MPEIILDGEKVTFEGTSPGTLGELRMLFEQVLQANGRLLASLEADSEPCSDDWADRRIDEFHAVVGASTTEAEAVRQLALAAHRDLEQVSIAADDLANQVLRRAWSDVQGDSISVVESIAQLATSVAALSAHSPDAVGLEALSGELSVSVEKLIDLIQAGDAARLSLCLDSDLLPTISRVHGGLSAVAGV